jgi:hypothetical protein
VYLLGSQRVRIHNVEVRGYNGDAISFQQCADIFVRDCHLHHNVRSGLHPGSGSVRYVMERNRIHDNDRWGIFYCLRTTHSICRNNEITRNVLDGINVGERDTDHLIESNTIRENGGAAIAWRGAGHEGGERTIVRGNVVGPDCTKEGQAEFYLPPGIRDVHFVENVITPGGKPAFDVGAGCQRITRLRNQIVGERQAASEDEKGVADFPEVGPQALAASGARHLGIDQLPAWKEL